MSSLENVDFLYADEASIRDRINSKRKESTKKEQAKPGVENQELLNLRLKDIEESIYYVFNEFPKSKEKIKAHIDKITSEYGSRSKNTLKATEDNDGPDE